MPALGLGTWKSDPQEAYRAVRSALAVGYRHIDCAAAYQNEREIGLALADAFDAAELRREEVWVTSKLWNDCHEPTRVEPALHDSLAKLGVDSLDLYLIHWPVALKHGTEAVRGPQDFIERSALPLGATWEAMLSMRDRGLVRQVGVSNFSRSNIEQLVAATGVAPAVNQIELHPYLQQKALVSWCQTQEIAVTAYSPLGSPDSAQILGRRDDRALTDDPTIGEIAAAHGATAAQVLIAWALGRRTSVIPKSVHVERIAENWAARDLVLTPSDVERIAALDRRQRRIDGRLWFVGPGYSPRSVWDE